MIDKDDIVRVSFHSTRFTLIEVGVVLKRPFAPRDSWIIQDRNMVIHEITEPCTVTQLKKHSIDVRDLDLKSKIKERDLS